MRIDLIGCGCGNASLTREAEQAIQEAELLLGSQRLLDTFAPDGTPCISAVTAQELARRLGESGCARAAVLFSGDSGFYSGAAGLLPLLKEEEVRILPGISSLQLLAARLGQPWQSWRLFSAHGRECDAVAAVCGEGPAFFLTGGENSPASLCRQLSQAGLGDLKAVTGQRLGEEREQIRSGTARDLMSMRFDPLSVLLVEAAPRPIRRSPGLADEMFQRAENIPMTKQEVRALALAKLAIGPEDVCWDIGAGTGSVGIEMALISKAVFGVERSGEALALAGENRRSLGAWKLRLIQGEAPEALPGLLRPDAVFIGGSGGRLTEILRYIIHINPSARICVSAIAPETLHAAISTLEDLGVETEICQLAVTRSRKAGELHLMLAQNPVWLIVGRAK